MQITIEESLGVRPRQKQAAMRGLLVTAWLLLYDGHLWFLCNFRSWCSISICCIQFT